MRVLGVDPGLTVTGLAVIEGGEVVDGHSIRGRAGVAGDFPNLARAADEIGYEVALAVHKMTTPPNVIAIEGFEDQGPARKRFANRHTTAMVCQAIYSTLIREVPFRMPIRWQMASQVLDRTRGYGWALGVPDPFPGWKLLSNEHERSAALHALWAETVARLEAARA